MWKIRKDSTVNIVIAHTSKRNTCIIISGLNILVSIIVDYVVPTGQLPLCYANTYMLTDVAEFDDSEVNPSESEAAKKKLPCPDCSQTFSCKFTLDRHMANKHDVVKSQTLPSGECPLCNAHVDHGESVMVHLREAHGFDVETQELHFNSIDGKFEHTYICVL